MKPRRVKSREQLLAVIRDRRDELDIAHTTIDALAGTPDGYTSKLLCDPPMKRFGPTSLGAILGALALGIIEITIVEDPKQAAQMAGRWKRRRRRPVRCVASKQHSFSFGGSTEEKALCRRTDR